MDVMQLRHNLLMNQPSGPLPSGYKQIEYIEGTGTQYIDIDPTSKEYEFEIELMITGTRANVGVITGSLGNGESDGTSIWYNATWMYVSRRNGNSDSSNDAAEYVSNALNVKITCSCFKSYAEISAIPGAVGRYRKNTNQVQTLIETPVVLFHCGAINTSFMSRYIKCRIYSAKFFNNGNLAYDLIPCIRKSDGAAGVYDLVGSTFYGNSGTGTFVVPE